MRRGKTWLMALWALTWLICLIDGICRIGKSTFLGDVGGNAATSLFFVFPLLLLLLCRRQRRMVRFFRIYALVELIAVPVLMVAWVATWTGSEWVSNAILAVLVAVSTPVPCCTAMIAPLFGWGLLLFGSLALRPKGKPTTKA